MLACPLLAHDGMARCITRRLFRLEPDPELAADFMPTMPRPGRPLASRREGHLPAPTGMPRTRLAEAPRPRILPLPSLTVELSPVRSPRDTPPPPTADPELPYLRLLPRLEEIRRARDSNTPTVELEPVAPPTPPEVEALRRRVAVILFGAPQPRADATPVVAAAVPPSDAAETMPSSDLAHLRGPGWIAAATGGLVVCLGLVLLLVVLVVQDRPSPVSATTATAPTATAPTATAPTAIAPQATAPTAPAANTPAAMTTRKPDIAFEAEVVSRTKAPSKSRVGRHRGHRRHHAVNPDALLAVRRNTTIDADALLTVRPTRGLVVPRWAD